MNEKKKAVLGFIKEYNDLQAEADTNTYAASMTFFLFLSLIPILIILSFVLPLTGQGSAELIEVVTEIMPDYFDEFASRLITEIYDRTSNILPFYIIILLWTASGSMFALTKGLHKVYRVKSEKSTMIIRLQAVLYTLALFMFFTVSMLFLIFQNRLTIYFTGLLSQKPLISALFLYWRKLVTIPLYLFFLTVIYSYISKKKIKWKYHLPGAVVTTVLWQLFGKLFSFYLKHVNTYDTFYGNLAILIVLLLWLYICCIIFLHGGLLNYYLIEKKYTGDM